MTSKVLSFSNKKKLPMIFQDERSECGAACVAMISDYWGHRLDLYTIRCQTETSNRGSTLSDISGLLEGLGFITRPLRISLDALSLIRCPAILHWDMNHFVVVKQVNKKYVVIHDPALGVRYCRWEEVSQSFTGIVLEVEKSSDFQAIRHQHKLTLSSLVKTIRGINTFVALLVLLSFAIEGLNLLNPLFIQYVADDVIGYSEKSNLYVISFGFLLLVIMQIFAEYLRGHMVIYLTNHLTEQFSSNIVRHILKLPLSFFEKRHKGDLQSKFQSIEHIQRKISTDFVTTVLDGFMIVINGVVMLMYSPLLTAIVVSSLFLFFSVRYTSYHQLRQQSSASVHQHAKAMTVFLETLQGIIPIKSFLKERVQFDVWRNSYIDALNADIQVAKKNVLYQIINHFLFHVEYLMVVCVGAILVLSHRFSLGMLMAFLSYRLLLVNKSVSFIQNVFDYKLIAIQLNRLSDILFQPPETISGGVGLPMKTKGTLALAQVSFQYHPNEKAILHNITICIHAGEKVAIIGRSGGGKSTLLKVMMGLLDKTSGLIEIDGMALETFGLKNYRELTAAVMQDDALLSGSIMSNIAFFDENIDPDRVYRVAKIASIHDDICRLPMGYETWVGDMGSTLSGGQKQRILLARALYKEPKILFLDEATSHLDVDNERKINQSLSELQMTQIVIAHRKETIHMADRVIDLDALGRCSGFD